MKKKTDKEKEKDFDYLNDIKTIGHLKKSKLKNYFKNKVLIGRFDADYLREFLKMLPKKEHLHIGIYRDKKGIAPLHCKGWLLSPRILSKDSKDSDFDKFKEF